MGIFHFTIGYNLPIGQNGLKRQTLKDHNEITI